MFMSILIYYSDSADAGESLRQIIERSVLDEKIEIYREIGALSQRLHRPSFDLSVAILFCCSKGDLLDILTLQYLLKDVRIILILPDDDDDTLAKGHALGPRFLSYRDEDFSDVAGVVSRMIGKRE
jgi:hypothetical protein